MLCCKSHLETCFRLVKCVVSFHEIHRIAFLS
jgi:hypothetical protein